MMGCLSIVTGVMRNLGTTEEVGRRETGTGHPVGGWRSVETWRDGRALGEVSRGWRRGAVCDTSIVHQRELLGWREKCACACVVGGVCVACHSNKRKRAL